MILSWLRSVRALSASTRPHAWRMPSAKAVIAGSCAGRACTASAMSGSNGSASSSLSFVGK